MLTINREPTRNFKIGSREHMEGIEKIKLNMSKCNQDRGVEVMVLVGMANISLQDKPSDVVTESANDKVSSLPELLQAVSKGENRFSNWRDVIQKQNDEEQAEVGENGTAEVCNVKTDPDHDDDDDDDDRELQERGPMFGKANQKYHPYESKSSSSSSESSPDSSPLHENSAIPSHTILMCGGSVNVCPKTEATPSTTTAALDIERTATSRQLSGGKLVAPVAMSPGDSRDSTDTCVSVTVGSSPGAITSFAFLDMTAGSSFMTPREVSNYSPSVYSPASSFNEDFGTPSPYSRSPEGTNNSSQLLLDDMCNNTFSNSFVELTVIEPSHSTDTTFTLPNDSVASSNLDIEGDPIQPIVTESDDSLLEMLKKYDVTDSDLSPSNFSLYSAPPRIQKPNLVVALNLQVPVPTTSRQTSIDTPRVEQNVTRYKPILPKPPPASPIPIVITEARRQSSSNPGLSSACKILSAKESLRAQLNTDDKNSAFEQVDCGRICLTESSDTGDTNLHISIAHDKLALTYAIVEKLVEKHESLDTRNKLGQTPLFVAVLKNSKLLVDYLLESGASPSLACIEGTTPLHHVASRGPEFLDVAESLCRSPSISLNQSNRKGLTPLHCAVQKHGTVDTIPMIRTLLIHGADLNTEDSCNRKTALLMAVENADLQAVRAICESCNDIKTKINYKSYCHGTALHVAAQLKDSIPEVQQERIINILLQYGADKTIKNKQNKCPKNLVDAQRKKVKELLHTPRRRN